MGELAAAKSEKATFLLINCEDGKSSDALKEYAKKAGATQKELIHLKNGKNSTYSGYYPYHVVIKDGKVAMNGGYDMQNRKWKDWEGCAGLK
mmetsp:Transcript_1201/g.1526  ORF Transcript_1201/g.1526 Transcript_1201/m.1526 type:complete len:92 (-) Transcript_1201:318-593(-)|eukprot:jgi/Bigna1/147166/aug1.131_g21874